MLSNDVMTGIFSSIAAAGLGMIGYIHNRLHSRFSNLELQATKHTIQLGKKLDREEVKEVVNDKLEGIVVTLEEIKDDVKDIKHQLRGKNAL